MRQHSPYLVVGLERVLGSSPGVRVFASQNPTQKGRVLGQLWYEPSSKTILLAIDRFEARHTIKMLKYSLALEKLMLR